MPLSPQIPPQPRDIEILASPGVQLLDATGPLQVFASANELAGAGAEDAPYCVRMVAAAAPVASSAGLRLFADPLPSPRAPVDTLIVAGGRGVQAAAGGRSYAGAGGQEDAGGGSSAIAHGKRFAGQAVRGTVRLWLRGNDAPQLSAPDRNYPAGRPHAICARRWCSCLTPPGAPLECAGPTEILYPERSAAHTPGELGVVRDSRHRRPLPSRA
jgi:hypothetical protein